MSPARHPGKNADNLAIPAYALHRFYPMLQHIDEQHGSPGLRGPRRVTQVSAAGRAAQTSLAVQAPRALLVPSRPTYPVIRFDFSEPIEEIVDFGGRPFARTPSGWSMIDETDIRGWAPADW